MQIDHTSFDAYFEMQLSSWSITLLLLFHIPYTFAVNLSTNSSQITELEPRISHEDCPICLDPIQKVYPNYFNCTHHNFHRHCIFGSFSYRNPIKVTKCPLCRAPFDRNMTEFENDYVISLIQSKNYVSFRNIMKVKDVDDKLILKYASLLVKGSKLAIITMGTLVVKDWDILLLMYVEYLRNDDSFISNSIIHMGLLSSAHLRYTFKILSYHKGKLDND